MFGNVLQVQFQYSFSRVILSKCDSYLASFLKMKSKKFSTSFTWLQESNHPSS